MKSHVEPIEPVAIIGIGCRLPGGVTGPASLWDLLQAGVDAVGPVPPDRWDADRYYAPDWQRPGRMTAREGGFLERVDFFDAAFFGIPSRVADQMDPQQRLLLEVCWEAFEDAGVVPADLAGTSAAVFVGACSQDYAGLQTAPDEIEGLGPHSATGMYASILSNRLSYTFDLRGPSMTLDTACSSSLVAVDLACRSLLRGESDLAVAGGVNVMLSPEGAVALSQASMLSPRCRSRAFDASADGYVRGEGAGVVVLKLLRQALLDDDRVYAVIRGSAVNQDGRTQGITVPSIDAQEANALAALRVAGVQPSEVGYVEAHGTGTPVGDPIEVAALGRALSAGRDPDRKALIGSIKTNIGHLEGGAGIAGLIKAALSVHHRRIPANLHFATPNPEIDFERWRLAVPTRSQPWPAGYAQAVATVNSFGFGGTNANVVLQEPPASSSASEVRVGVAAPTVLTLSASSEDALARLAGAYRQRLQAASVDLPQVAAALALRRSHHEYRLTVQASDAAEAAAKLGNHLDGLPVDGVVVGRARRRSGRLAFLFNGQGPQWHAMGRTLLTSSATFRAAVEECDEAARQVVDWSILDALAADETSSPVGRTAYLQPMMFAVQVGLARLWNSWGVTPDAVAGHSMGEIAAAHLSGALDLASAIRIICLRARIQDTADPTGAMMFTGLGRDEAQRLCETAPGRMWVSAENSPVGTTLSGRREALKTLAADLTERGVFARILQVNCACHSPDMDPLRDQLVAELDGITGKLDTVPIYSTVTGQRIAGTELGTPYWWRNFREPVRFAPAIRAMIADGFDTFVELSPHPVLVGSVTELLAEAGVTGQAIGSLSRKTDDWRSMGEAFGALYVSGCDIDWSRRHPGGARAMDLPTNPWDHQSFWNEGAVSQRLRTARQPHPMLHPIDAPRPNWEIKWDDHRLSWVRDHDVLGSVIVPGAAFVEAALAAARQLTGMPCDLQFVQFERACVLSDEPQVSRIELDAEKGTFECHSRALRGETWVRSAVGRFHRSTAVGGEALDLRATQTRCPAVHQAIDIYATLRRKGYAYGPALCGIERLNIGPGEVLARIRTPRVVRQHTAGYLFHPAVLDACFQSVIVHPIDGRPDDLLPVQCLLTGVDEVRLHGEPAAPAWCRSRIRTLDAHGLSADVCVFDEQGRLLAEFVGLTGKAVPQSSVDHSKDLYEPVWRRDARMDRRSTRSALTERPATLRSALDRTAAAEAKRLHRGSYAYIYGPAVRALCAAYVVRCLRELGRNLVPGESFTIDDLPGIVPEYRRAVNGFLQFLVDDGVLAHDDGCFRVNHIPDVDAGELFAAAFLQHPTCAMELRLLDSTASQLSAIVTGQVDPLSVLFPGGSPAEVESIYQTAPSTRLYNIIVGEAVRLLVCTADPKRSIRILEVGGGTGGLTAHVLPLLPSDRCEYLFTDVSAAFVQHAVDRFGHHACFTRRTLDVEADLVQQGVAAGAYDLILASDVLHATEDLDATLRRLRAVLAPGGVLAVIEAEPGSRWLELTFGLVSGWWRFRDTERRPHGPLMPAAQWDAVLHEAGFGEVLAVQDPDHSGAGAQNVLLAWEPGPGAAAQSYMPSVREQHEPEQLGHWVLVGDPIALGADLIERIQSRGGHVSVVAPGGSADSVLEFERILRDVEPEAVVHIIGAAGPEPADGMAMHDRSVQSCLQVIHSLQAIERTILGERPKTFVLTRGAHALRGDAISLDQAPLWGIGLVAGLEMPQVPCMLIDLDPEPEPDELDAVWSQFWRRDYEREVTLRGGESMNRRIRPLTRDDAEPTISMRNLPATARFVLETASPGSFDDLRYQVHSRPAPGPDEVEIEVVAAGLNFLDIMTALGQVPPLETGPGHRFGAECAGILTRVGDQARVAGLQPGDPVIAVSGGAGTLASHLVLNAALVVSKPSKLSFEEAASLPIVFLTAWLALRTVARLASGERILVHSATGGTGLAALQVARLCGAEVIATAGSPEKRALLRSLGVRHVMDSRSSDFATEVSAITGGAGVDVVLGATTGENFRRSLDCLAPYGRFIELGKRNSLTDITLGLRPFLRNLTFASFDLRQMVQDRPGAVQAALREVLSLVEQGTLHALPLRVFHPSQTRQAFRQLAAARHVGKLVVSMIERDTVATVEAADRPESATWLVTGGLGGVGLAMAESLATSGVSHLALVSRSGTATGPALARIESLRARGVDIMVDAVDVTSRSAVHALIAAIDKRGAPLRGVLHCAMVLDDAPLSRLDEPQLEHALGAKVAGAWNLHQATAHLPLDEFVLFSSAASMIGNRGQANYAAGNAFLDHLAYARRARALPALVVNWGVFSDVGYVAAHNEVATMVAATGMKSLTSDEAFATLTRLRRGRRTQVGVLPVDWTRFFRHYDQQPATQPRYELLDLSAAADAPDDGPLAAPGAPPHAVVAARLTARVAAVLGMPSDALDADLPLMGYLDSLLAVEIISWIERELGRKVTIMELMNGPSITELSQQLIDATVGSADARVPTPW